MSELKLYESDDKDGTSVLVWAHDVDEARRLTNNYEVVEFTAPDEPRVTEYSCRY